MNPSVKVIETDHHGILYRSRLEARWAVFYSTLGIKFHYEPEAFSIGGHTGYLPDFFLPEQDCYVEIKPAEPSPEEESKCESVARHTRKRCFLFYGPIQSQLENTQSAIYFGEKGGRDYQYRWCRCRSCGQLDIQFDGRSFRMRNHRPDCRLVIGPDEHPDKGYSSCDSILQRAYQLAASHRFV